MKEIFLKVCLILVAAVIAIPLLISLWPKDTLIVKRDTALTNKVIVPDDWVQYENNDVDLNFWYPPELSQTTSVTISGFYSVEDTLVATFANKDKTNTELGNDIPFDGFSVYIYDLAAGNVDITFEELIGAEKIAMKESFETLNGSGTQMPSISEESFTFGKNTVIKITSPGQMTHYYMTWKNNNVLSFSSPRTTTDPFITILEDILKTVDGKDNV